MKNFKPIPLLNFEGFIEDHLLLKAEQMFDEGNLADIDSPEKGVWNAKIKAEKDYSVEARVHDGKIQKANCSCEEFARERICTHLTVFFYGIRHFENQIVAKKTTKRQRKRRAGTKDYLQLIFNNISSEEINNFINSYALSNRPFKLLLATHFSRKIQDHTGTDIYDRILDECFPVKTENTNKSYSTEARLLIKIGRELLINYKDAISLEAYTEAFHMIQSLNDKIAYALYIYQKDNKMLTDLQQKVHNSYRMLINGRMAPGLKHEIISEMINSIGKSFYHYRGQDNLFELIISAEPTSELFLMLIETIDNKISNQLVSSEASFLLAHMIFALQKVDSTAHQDKLTTVFSKDPYLLLETLGKMINLNMINEVNQALDYYKAIDQIDEKIYLSFRLKFFIAKGDFTRGLETAFKLFEITLDPSYIRPVKSMSGDNWPSAYARLLDILYASDNPVWYEIALDLTQNEGDHKSLYNLLIEKKNIDYFMRYDWSIANSYTEEIYLYYRDFTLNYLKQHAGVKAADKILKVLSHLQEIGLVKETLKLEKEITAKYPERKTLQSMLS